MVACPFVCTFIGICSSVQSEHRSPKFEGRSPFGSSQLQQAVSKLHQEYVYSCQPLGMGDRQLLLCKELKLIEINHSVPSKSSLEAVSKSSINSRVPNSYMRQIMPVQLLSRWGGRILMLSSLPSSQNPFLVTFCPLKNELCRSRYCDQ